MKTITLTFLALIAFAANSVLCRLALGNESIDASNFTSIRLLSGVIVLFFILKLKSRKPPPSITKGSWFSGSMLFLYAITFSFAYITLDTGTGALILFGAVQITIIIYSIIAGHKLHLLEWIGVLISFLGFIYLILPGVTSPSLIGFILMSIAGVAWGIYTVRGKASKDSLRDTAFNFLKTIPFVLIVFVFTLNTGHYSYEGVLLAIISGGITSGIGYTIWYMALRGLTTVQSAVVQLLVPVIAAFGGVLFISEVITYRLTISSILILGGILLVVIGKNYIDKSRFKNNVL